MTKAQLLARWHIIQKNMQERGMDPQLDLLSDHSILVIVGSQQNLSGLLEWGYGAWSDVKSVWQQQDDTHRYFGVAFRKDKLYDPQQEDD